jgi:hypothetical protein
LAQHQPILFDWRIKNSFEHVKPRRREPLRPLRTHARARVLSAGDGPRIRKGLQTPHF